METLLVCPRCNAFVQPQWPMCRICGYDPYDPQTHAPIEHPSRPKERIRFGTILGGLATLVVLGALTFGVVKGSVYLWEHRQGPVEHQQYVVVER